jgi:hypothetical protein
LADTHHQLRRSELAFISRQRMAYVPQIRRMVEARWKASQKGARRM